MAAFESWEQSHTTVTKHKHLLKSHHFGEETVRHSPANFCVEQNCDILNFISISNQLIVSWFVIQTYNRRQEGHTLVGAKSLAIVKLAIVT